MTAKVLDVLTEKGYLVFAPDVTLNIIAKVRLITTWYFEMQDEPDDVRRTYKMAPYLVAKNSKKLTEAVEEALRKAFPDYSIRVEQVDACEVCGGISGGVPGNENTIGSTIMCDYCHARQLRKEQ